MDIKNITKALELMKEHNLTKFSYEKKDNFKLCLEKQVTTTAVAQVPVAPVIKEESTISSSAKTITAPLVGTFYQSPSPEAESYVKEGDEFKEGDVLCIIDSMKVMNEIRAEHSGTITKILVENASPIEYGQALFEYN